MSDRPIFDVPGYHVRPMPPIPEPLPQQDQKESLDSILNQRNDTYGPAWLVTGRLVEFIKFSQKLDLDPMFRSGYFYNWITILCKLIRLLRTPDHLDSWQDIAGYATIIVRDLESRR